MSEQNNDRSFEDAQNEHWGETPIEERNRWCAMFLDFPPTWPTAVVMNIVANQVKQGSHAAPLLWGETAQSLRAVGFTPDEYYLLRLCLRGGRDDRELCRRGGSDLLTDTTRYSSNGPRTLVPVAEAWSLWLELVRSGSTPLSATNLILDRGEGTPRGMIVGRGGIISTTDD